METFAPGGEDETGMDLGPLWTIVAQPLSAVSTNADSCARVTAGSSRTPTPYALEPGPLTCVE